MTLTEAANRTGITALQLARISGYSRAHLYAIMRDGKMDAKVARRIRKAIIKLAEEDLARSRSINQLIYDRRMKVAEEIWTEGGAQ